MLNPFSKFISIGSLGALFLIGVVFVGKAQADVGMPKEASLLTQVGGPLQTLTIPDIKLSLIQGTCDATSDYSWLSISGLNQSLTFTINNEKFVSTGAGSITFVPSAPSSLSASQCQLQVSNIDTVAIAVADPAIQSLRFEIVLNLITKTVSVIQASGGQGGLAAVGQMTSWY